MAAPMVFWGIEIKGNKPQKIELEEGELIHLSHATLGDLKKGSEPVVLSVKVGEQKLNLGILNADKAPQLSFDLVFEQDFELSHNSKNGSIHLLGYKSVDDGEGDAYPSDSSDESDEEMVPAEKKASGKPAAAAAKPKAKTAAPVKKEDNIKEDSDEDDSEDDDEDDSEDEDESDDEDILKGGDDSDEDDSEEEESDEEDTPAKPVVDGGKKRPASNNKTPEAKKVKIATTPQKTDGKKPAGSQTATPHPAKKSGKATSNGDKSNSKTPKSAGQVTCGSCSRNFTNEKALESHTKAKHSAK